MSLLRRVASQNQIRASTALPSRTVHISLTIASVQCSHLPGCSAGTVAELRPMPDAAPVTTATMFDRSITDSSIP